MPGGAILAISVSDTGTGFALGDTGNIVQGANTTCTYLVTSLTGLNGVDGFPVVDPGSGYSLGAATFVPGGAQPGAGTGWIFEIATVSPDAGGSGYGNRFF